MNNTPIQAFAIGDKNNCIAYSILGATQIIFLRENQETTLSVQAKNKELPFGCLGMKFVHNLLYTFGENKRISSFYAENLNTDVVVDDPLLKKIEFCDIFDVSHNHGFCVVGDRVSRL